MKHLGIKTIGTKALLLFSALLFLVFGVRYAFFITDNGGSVSYSLGAVFGSFLLGLLLYAGIRLLLRLPDFKLSKTVRIVFLLLITLLPRLGMIFFSGLELRSDYAFYLTLGSDFADGGALSELDYIAKVAPNVTVYGAVLGVVMRIFGKSSTAVLLFNLALFTGSVFSLDAIARELTDRRRALIVSTLFALLPESILYSAYPGIEYITLFPMLLGLYLLLLSLRMPGRKGRIAALCSGAAIAFSFINRANVAAILPGTVLWYIVQIRKNPALKKPKEALLAAALFAAAFAAVYAAYSLFQNHILAGRDSASPIGWALYEGLDRLNNGGWTAEKSEHLYALMESGISAREMQLTLLRDAWERVSAYSFGEWLDMFARKGAVVWFNSGYCMDYNDASPFLQRLYVFANGFWNAWMVCLILSLFVQAFRKKTITPPCTVLLCLLPILFTALWHLFATSIPRYHYMMIPLIILLPVLMIPEFPKRSVAYGQFD